MDHFMDTGVIWELQSDSSECYGESGLTAFKL